MTLKELGLPDASLSILSTNLAKYKYNRLQKFKDLFNKESEIDISDSIGKLNTILNESDNSDYDSMMSQACEVIKNYKPSNIDSFKLKLFIIKNIITNYMIKYHKNISSNFINNAKYFLDNVEIIISNNNEYLQNLSIDRLYKSLAVCTKKLIYKYKNNIENSDDYIVCVSPKDKAEVLYSACSNLVENANTSGTIIKSIANYSTTKYFPQLTTRTFNPEEYVAKIFNESDDDSLANDARKVNEFLKALFLDKHIADSDDTSISKCDIFKKVCEYLYDKLINNSTGLVILKNQLSDCVSSLDDMVSDSYMLTNEIECVKDTCNIMIDKINQYFKNSKDNPELSSSPLIEMGFGYFYDIIPSNIETLSESSISSICESIDYANNNIDTISILNEGIISKIKRYEDDKYEFDKRKKEDKYEFNKRMNERKIEDEYESDKRKKDDKYEFNKRMNEREDEDHYDTSKRKKDDKYEFNKRMKERKKEDKYEADKRKKEKKQEEKENRVKTLSTKFKTLELSTPAVYKAMRALRRLVSAAGLGAVGYAAFGNPIFLPIIYLLQKYLKDKTYPDDEKRRVMLEMQKNINQIDAKLEEAERKGDMKAKYSLLKMKDKMESLYKRNNYSSGRNVVM